ncbi:SUMF1/EgtB/PvdO family nonheme iron enzyme [Blastopirellula sp. JC732]|uniref:non-specific serine/threonine protein kinase n=1 Tax=Blastopirellula sediminis TaxID=2894196 RepID=A0A9X1MKV2_9BACT|nr:bifunctional serine/threonine-protein kinase/formylglycine-generating enzyme family protein [Blastopirellula sediminis]MCC9609066.1 SUMF1/EgtB/PvdO family nonheme iron enzyme [Blastopirellula sediminis]MCC9628157.1 SUMF1/EgtB/PvdO family nonheme iron enzyme [Blastopirellula sediminis]
MDKQEQLQELLAHWNLRRQQGDELSAEELCPEHPELVPELSQLIHDFKLTNRLAAYDDSDDGNLQETVIGSFSPPAETSSLPQSELSLDAFYQRVVDSGLINAPQVHDLRARSSAADARSFAQQLVEEKQLTHFQAKVLLEGGEFPLVLDRYILLDELGAGGMGVVYKALHQEMDRLVALKILPKEAVNSEDKVRRFHREVKTAAKLDHPNIVAAFDADEDKGYHFLVMSLVNANDLSKIVRQQGPLPIAQAVDCIIQAARGLAHAHQLGIIHRDIKPANLLLTNKGKVKILDMGLARIERGDSEQEKSESIELTQTGMVMGTIAYLAPEQAFDTRAADARSDIYSLGCTLYFLLTGRVIYRQDTMMKTLMAHRDGAIPSLCDQRQDVPAELDAVFQKMVAKRPEDRFQSMTDVIAALETLPSGDEAKTSSVAARPGRSTAQRWSWIAAGLLGGVALLAGFLLQLQTPAGTVVLEINQPEIAGAEVLVDGEKKITITTGQEHPRIEITPDENRHDLTVKLAGFQTFTKEFSFATGNEQSIKVRLEPTSPATHTSSNSPDQFAAERKVAEWTTKLGGWVLLESPPQQNATTESQSVLRAPYVTHFDATNSTTKTAKDLPDGDFLVRGVFARSKPVADEDLRRLEELRSLVFLDLGSCPTTDNGMQIISKLTTLRILYLSHTAITDKGFSLISSLTNLESVGLSDTQVTSTGLAALEDLPRLHELSLSGPMFTPEAVDLLKTITPLRELFVYQLTDEHLRQISRLQQLKRITIFWRDNSYSAEGLANLKQALPDCTVNVLQPTSPVAAQIPNSNPTFGNQPPVEAAPLVVPFTAQEAEQQQAAWAKRLGVPVEMENSIGMKFRVIPPGEFLMGSSEVEVAQLLVEGAELPEMFRDMIRSETPQQKQVLPAPIAVGIHEVRRGDFRKFVAATGYQTDAETDGFGGWGLIEGKPVRSPEFLWNNNLGLETQQLEEHPVFNVSKNDAVAFCRWLSDKEGVTYRLPTEAEWEFACRSGTTTRYNMDVRRLNDFFAWGKASSPVGSKQPNNFGLFDMHGNAHEWCEGKEPVFRGGNFGSDPIVCRSASRWPQSTPTYRTYFVGFRIVRTFDPPNAPQTDSTPEPEGSPSVESSDK